jgi:glyoxylase-like metal-dependent hydrolase (beta-lactamase superfamily II)
MFTLPSSVTFLERGWLSSNNVILQDEEQAILIDTGYWTHALQTESLINSALGNRQLKTIINTHLHSDHCGANAHLQQRFEKLETWIPPGHAMHVDAWNPEALTYTPTGQHCPPFTRSALLQQDDVFKVNGCIWRIHAAPGHDPHSIIIFNEEDGILISADALWENGFGVVFPEIEGVQAFNEVESTLQLIEQLNPRWVLPGHGCGFGDVAGALTRARSRLLQFRNSPDKHANYAAKVLLKFKLLELQKIALNDFYIWANSADYLCLLQQEYATTLPFNIWIESLCVSLTKSGACKIEDAFIFNI